MRGTLVYVMGASGAGKDSLIAFARQQMRNLYDFCWGTGASFKGLRPLVFTRRFITRPADPKGEGHVPVSPEEFHNLRQQNAFALYWQSHGLCYGIHTEINSLLRNNAVVIVNGSRKYLPEALQRYPALVPVLVSVRPDVLSARLHQRRRESADEILRRLAQATLELPSLPNLVSIENSGNLATAGNSFWRLLYSLCRKI